MFWSIIYSFHSYSLVKDWLMVRPVVGGDGGDCEDGGNGEVTLLLFCVLLLWCFVNKFIGLINTFVEFLMESFFYSAGFRPEYSRGI